MSLPTSHCILKHAIKILHYVTRQAPKADLLHPSGCLDPALVTYSGLPESHLPHLNSKSEVGRLPSESSELRMLFLPGSS